MKKLVIFSHGFGVRQDSRGFFTEIIEKLGLTDAVTFDYGTTDETSNTTTIPPLREQADNLERVVRREAQAKPDRDIVVIGHSQGCVIAALAHLPKISKVIMLAPPFKLGSQQTASKFRDRPGTVINPQGESRFARADGSVTIVSQDYLGGLDELDPIVLINRLAKTVPITVIKAEQDEVLSRFELEEGELDSHVKLLFLPGDHNFTGSARAGVIELIGRELARLK